MREERGEWDRLQRLYAEYSDGELLELAQDAEDLTETAQEVLRSEMAARRLVLTAARDPDGENGADTEEAGAAEGAESGPPQPGRCAELAPPECVWEFPEWEDAEAAAIMLTDAGIVCDVPRPDTMEPRWAARGPRLAVLPEDVERARVLLREPIAEEFRERARTRVEDFVAPSCPQCGAVDPLLEATEPNNRWRCERCEHGWEESAELAEG